MARVLLGWKPEWRDLLEGVLTRAGHEVTMARLDETDPSGFDAVVPMELPDQWHLACHRAAGRRVRGLWPTLEARDLMHDKLRFNRLLIANGFAANVPALHDRAPADPAAYPLILKAREAAFGAGCTILRHPDEAEALRPLIEGPDHFLQDYVKGGNEWATHLLMCRGRLRFQATAIYFTGLEPIVKGQDHPLPVAGWLDEPMPWLDELMAMLALAGFTDGACAINWRERDDRMLIFEINPRFGSSLALRADEFLTAYLAALDDPEGPAIR